MADSLSALTSPGPSGERQEHLTAILDEGRPRTRRRMRRVLADLGFRWAVGALPRECRWLLDTQAMFLKKTKIQGARDEEDDAWLGWLADVPEDEVVQQQPAQQLQQPRHPTQQQPQAAAQAPATPRPIQMGEFLRKWAARRHLGVEEASIARAMIHTR